MKLPHQGEPVRASWHPGVGTAFREPPGPPRQDAGEEAFKDLSLGLPNKLTRFVCLGCKGARTARDKLLQNPQPPADVPEGTSSGPAASSSGQLRVGHFYLERSNVFGLFYLGRGTYIPGYHGGKASSPRTSTTTATSGPSSSTPTARQPLRRRLPHFLLTEERHLLLASGGYVTRRTREFILPRAFIDHLDSIQSPLLEAN